MSATRLIAVSAVALVVVATASAAQPLRVVVAGIPVPSVAGEPWTATVRVTPTPASAQLILRSGASSRTFALRKVGLVFRGRIVLPTAGRWTMTVRAGARDVHLQALLVRTPPLALLQPYGVVEQGPAYLVADRQRNAVYRIDEATGSWKKLASIVHAREVAPLDSSHVLVSSDDVVFSLDTRTGATTEVAGAQGVVLGLASGAAGTLYASEDGTRVVELDGGQRRVVVDGLNGVHGLALVGTRLIACETFAGNLLSIDPKTGATTTIARGLDNPTAVVSTNAGLLVTEFATGRIVRVASDGTVTPLARLPGANDAALARSGALLASSLLGRIVRVDPTTGVVRTIVGSS